VLRVEGARSLLHMGQAGYISTTHYSLLHTLSQKQFGKYFSAEIFLASMGIVPVLFKKIYIQQHPRKKYL
jgi:hypothetical protein